MNISWENAGNKLKELRNLLKCRKCQELKTDLHSFERCDHCFCKECASAAINENSMCPTCGTVSWMKELKVNRQLANTVKFCLALETSLLGSASEVNDANYVDMRNTTESPCVSDNHGKKGSVVNLVKEKSVPQHDNRINDSSDLSSWQPNPGNGPQYTYSKRGKHQLTTTSKNGDAKAPKKKCKSANAKNMNGTLQTIDDGLQKVPPEVICQGKENTRVPEKEPKGHKGKGPSNKGKPARSTQGKAATPKVNLVEKRNKRGENPLHVACIKGNVAEAKGFLEQGANPNCKDFAGWTPLHEASNHGFVDIVELLLDHGALINIPGYEYDSPLHDAVRNHRENAVEVLLKRGASVFARNKHGHLPIDYAQTEKIKALLSEASLNQTEEPPSGSFDGFVSGKNSADKEKVILVSGLTDKEMDNVRRCAATLKTVIVEEYNDKVTHLVTATRDSNTCSRTIKYLLALLNGMWIVSYDWVKQSSKKGKWLPEIDYEVAGTDEACDNMPRKARLNAENQLPRLFDGCSFFLHGKTSNITQEELVQLLKTGDGKLLTREPKIDEESLLISFPESSRSSEPSITQATVYHAKPSSGLSVCTQYIVYDKESKRKPKLIQSPTLATVPVSWILECISRFELVQISDVS